MCNTPPHGVIVWGWFLKLLRPLLAGIDTLHLHTAAAVRPELAVELEKARSDAKIARKTEEPVHVQLGHLRLPIRAYGTRRGPFLLENELVAFTLNPDAPAPFPTVSVELRAIALWNDGWEAAAAAALRVMEWCCGGPVNAQVSRVDVCLDFQGWVPRESDRTLFVCRAKKVAAYWTGRRSTGWTFGRGDQRGNLYDKRLDCEDKNKMWFELLWKRTPGYDKKAPVWRLEFQLCRQALKDLNAKHFGGLFDFESWDNFKMVVPNVWELLTDTWLRLGKRSAKKRKNPSAVWREVQQVENFGQLERSNVQLYKKRIQDAHAKCVPQFAGYAARGIAEMQHAHGEQVHAPIEASEDVWLWNLAKEAKAYLSARGTSLDEKVRVLRRAMNDASRSLSDARTEEDAGAPEAHVLDFLRRRSKPDGIGAQVRWAILNGERRHREADQVAAELALGSAVLQARRART